MKRYLLLLVLISFTISVYSQQITFQKSYGGTGDDWVAFGEQTTDGGYIITGFTTYYLWNPDATTDILLIKTDALGDTLWTRTIAGTEVDFARSIKQTSDGGYIICGHINSPVSNDDIYLAKIDSSGVPIWTKTFGGTGNDAASSVQQTTDGGYIICGGNDITGGSSGDDVYLIKTDANGDTLWTKVYGGTDIYDDDAGLSVQQTSDGGYIIAGVTLSFGAGHNDAYLIKTDASGDTLWTRTFGGSWFDIAYSVQQTTDGGYILTGYFSIQGQSADVYLIKTDSMGNSGCYQTNPATIVQSPPTILASPATIVTSPATVVTAPTAIIGNGGVVNTLCTSVGIQSEINNPKSGISVSPNPFTSAFAVQSSEEINQIIIYDLVGTKVFEKQLPSNKTSAELNLSFLQQGVYFLNVKANGESRTRKIVKM